MCDECASVRQMVMDLGHDYKSLVLVVDGSYNHYTKCAGAGLVLARASDEAVVATCAAAFKCPGSNAAELQAIRRGLRWAPVGVAWSDCMPAIGKAKKLHLTAKFIPDDLRDPLHSLAHRLAEVGQRRDWERYDRLWIPGAVW